MPYYKKKFKKSFGKRFGKRRMFRPKYTVGGSAKFLAKKALSAVAYVRSLLNTERKYLDVAPSTNSMIGTNPTSDCISLVTLGDGPFNREGRQVKTTSLFIRGILALNASNNSDIVRCLVVQARTLAVPAINTILTTQDTIAPRNLNNVRDYDVLYDKTFNLDKEKNDKIQFKIPLKITSKLQFNVSDTAGQANPTWGAIYIMCFARELTNESSFTYWSRLRYIDN